MFANIALYLTSNVSYCRCHEKWMHWFRNWKIYLLNVWSQASQDEIDECIFFLLDIEKERNCNFDNEIINSNMYMFLSVSKLYGLNKNLMMLWLAYL